MILHRFFVSIVYFSVFFSIYFLTNDWGSDYFIYTKYFNLTISLIIILFLTISMRSSDKKINVLDFLLMLVMMASVLMTLIFRGYFNFHWIYILFAYFYFKDNVNSIIPINIRKNVLVLSSFITLLWLLSIRFVDGRPVTNWFDPNYSGFFIFILFMFLRFEGMKLLSYIILIAGFLTLSRSYALSVAIFFFFSYFSFFSKLFFHMKLNKFITIAFIGLVLLIPIENNFASKNERLSVVNKTGIATLTTVEDASNQARFTANLKFKDDLLEKPLRYQFGIDLEKYTSFVFHNSPHNAFYLVVLNYGFYFAIPFFILFGRVYNRYFNFENLPIILSLFPYYLLLGAGIQGLPGLLVFYLLSIDKRFYK